LLITRDYELIRESFSKLSIKLDTSEFFDVPSSKFISRSYRLYNAAYFEEVLLSEQIDGRVALNYRERFLVEPIAIYQVLQMYSKKDYLEQFLEVDLSGLQQQQFIELFLICWRYDAFKVALHLYLKCLSVSDISKPVIDRFIDGIRDSCRYLEIKLFFVLEHFDSMNILQLNRLVDALQHVVFRDEVKLNPILNSYNTVKLSLLIYRVSWCI